MTLSYRCSECGAELKTTNADALDWQPLRTAPKDGTSILVTMEGGDDGPYYVLFWNGSFFECASSGIGPSMDHLSHWMPIQAPPPEPKSP